MCGKVYGWLYVAGMMLERRLRRTQRSAFASGTAANLRAQGRKLLVFLQELDLVLPLTVHQFCLYTQYLSLSLTSPQSIRNYLSGARTLHKLLGFEPPELSELEIRLTLRGLDKVLSHVTMKACPVTCELLLDMAKHMNFKLSVDVTVWCMFLFLFFLFARKSQFVPLTTKMSDVSKLVLRSDVCDEGDHLVCTFRWTKTSSPGSIVKLPLVPIHKSILCPVSAYRLMVTRVPASESSPLFVYGDSKGRLIPLTYYKFQTLFRALVQASGRDPSLYSSHSFRRGGATHALKLGLPSELIKTQGNWRSDAYLGYLDVSFQQRMKVAQAFSVGLDG